MAIFFLSFGWVTEKGIRTPHAFAAIAVMLLAIAKGIRAGNRRFHLQPQS